MRRIEMNRPIGDVKEINMEVNSVDREGLQEHSGCTEMENI